MAVVRSGWTAAAMVVTGILVGTGPASAAPPLVDAPCGGDELGRGATAADGSAVMCIADDAGRMTWMPEGGAVRTIAELQAQGYTVTIDQIGDDPLPTCIVTQVHNAMTTT
ncbi:MAG: hypothetical protein FGM52_08510, partial [Mycobacterium sp.]|nr:hypothetical protein [Mycobacterium sp.]